MSSEESELSEDSEEHEDADRLLMDLLAWRAIVAKIFSWRSNWLAMPALHPCNYFRTFTTDGSQQRAPTEVGPGNPPSPPQLVLGLG